MRRQHGLHGSSVLRASSGRQTVTTAIAAVAASFATYAVAAALGMRHRTGYVRGHHGGNPNLEARSRRDREAPTSLDLNLAALFPAGASNGPRCRRRQEVRGRSARGAMAAGVDRVADVQANRARGRQGAPNPYHIDHRRMTAGFEFAAKGVRAVLSRTRRLLILC